MSTNSIITTISLRNFRENTQKIVDSLKVNESITVYKRSKPLFTITSPIIDEWGDEVGRNDVNIDFRSDGVTTDEFFGRLKRDLHRKNQ